MDHNTESNKISKQSLTISIGSIIVTAINGIVAYIAVYFFKPIWEKIIKWWYSKEG
jgi:flagellar basal body-associated protein FliL